VIASTASGHERRTASGSAASSITGMTTQAGALNPYASNVANETTASTRAGATSARGEAVQRRRRAMGGGPGITQTIVPHATPDIPSVHLPGGTIAP